MIKSKILAAVKNENQSTGDVSYGVLLENLSIIYAESPVIVNQIQNDEVVGKCLYFNVDNGVLKDIEIK